MINATGDWQLATGFWQSLNYYSCQIETLIGLEASCKLPAARLDFIQPLLNLNRL